MATFTSTDGTEIFYKVWGQGRPVVLIHGWPLSSDSWDDVALAVANAGFQVFAYDRRGFGRSSHAWLGYDYDTLSADLAQLIEERELRNVSLVGFSMGGGEVIRYVSRYGVERLSSLVLVSSVIPFMLQTEGNPEGIPKEVFEEIKQGIAKDRPAFFAQFFKDFFGAGLISSPVSVEMLEWARSVSMQAGLKGVLDCIDAFSSTDFRNELHAITIPTLLIHGTEDKTVPITVSARVAVEGIAGASLIEYAGAPHGLFATHKERLIENLLDFLSGN